MPPIEAFIGGLWAESGQRVDVVYTFVKTAIKEHFYVSKAPPPSVSIWWLVILAVAIASVQLWVAKNTPGSALFTTIMRMLFFRGRRMRGELSGLRFPVKLTDLTDARDGPVVLTAMLRHGGHLPAGVRVARITDEAAVIRDGVKGDKGVITVEYYTDEPHLVAAVDLKVMLPPSTFFVKFNVSRLSVMRLLVDTSECAKCEAIFYTHLAHRLPMEVRTPKCYFVDYSELSGEFVLLSEQVRFGEGALLPLKHRIRDSARLDEQRAFVLSGGTLNATFWAGAPIGLPPHVLEAIPRFEETHRRMWVVAQALARFGGLHHTANRTLKGRVGVSEAFMTWRPPPELLGRERELIRDMPEILTSLCDPSTGLVAYGHNDITTDNVFFLREGGLFFLRFGLFDWQQSCFNNVGQEWAWNWHWLEPDFLDQHEDELIELLLTTYQKQGRRVAKADFLRAYVLGTAQMYVWGGGGLQALMGRLHSRGLLEGLQPDDARTRDGSVTDPKLLELFVGAEMTRRTFTNVCRIMRRHDFVGAWQRWQKEHGVLSS